MTFANPEGQLGVLMTAGATDPDRRRLTITLGDAAAGCDRACLIAMTERFLSALARRDPSALPLSDNVKFTENGVRLTIGEGLWKVPTTLVSRREVFADPVNGEVAVWSVLDEGGAPILLSARLKLQDQRIHEIETVVARKGSHALFSPNEFAALPSVYEQVLEPARRTPRDRLVAIADGYFEGIARHDDTLVSSAADAGATPPREARMLALAELFKIAGGEIQRIETVMHNLPYGSASGWGGR